MIGETVYNLDEFMAIIDQSKKIHYELKYEIRPLMGNIDLIWAVLRLYGLKGNIIVMYEERKRVKWDSDEIKDFMKENNLHNYNVAMIRWVEKKLEEMEKKAKDLGASPGNYFYFLEGLDEKG